MADSDLLVKLLLPSAKNAADYLAELDLGGLPTIDEIDAKIEEQFLTPKEHLPTHWLSAYQT